MATFSTTLYATKTPPNTGHGFNTSSVHLQATSGVLPVTLTTNDTINIGFLPPNAVVVSALLKAAGQMDSNGAPTLTLSLGVPGTAGLFKSAITTVGRAAGTSADATLSAAGLLYKNLTGAKQAILVTVANVAATPVAGTLEVDVEYFVEDPVGSAP
jgi:hypothetical protein